MAIFKQGNIGKIAGVVASTILVYAALPVFAQGGQQSVPPQRQPAKLVADPYGKGKQSAANVDKLRNGYWDPAYGWCNDQDMVILSFKVSSTLLMRDFNDNAEALDRLNEILSDRTLFDRVDHIVITGSASPEGSTAFNQKLSEGRANAVRSYIMWKFPYLDRNRIYALAIGSNWLGMRKLVQNDSRFKWKDAILRIIDSPMDDATKLARIRTLDSGAAYRYILENIMPFLRTAIVCQIFYKNVSPPEPVQTPAPAPIPVPQPVEPAPAPAPLPVPAPAPAPAPQPVEPAPKTVIGLAPAVEYERITKPLFAIKTNLLYDAVTAVNIEAEVPIGKRWSIAGEYIFPWWLIEDKQYCLELLSGSLEGRYWFGKRENRPVLTGWFGGLYAGGGYYDIGIGVDKGWQGEFFIATGLSGGYAHTINKKGNLRMEYSLGVGYLQTKYRLYDPTQICDGDQTWHLIRQSNGAFSWIGPTKAKISLVWLINYSYMRRINPESGLR